MALSKSGLKTRIVTELEAAGATATGEHSWVEKLAQAVANAVVDEIQSNANTTVASGSSAGTWPVT